jgi:hypothetical protein
LKYLRKGIKKRKRESLKDRKSREGKCKKRGIKKKNLLDFITLSNTFKTSILHGNRLEEVRRKKRRNDS